MDNKDYTTEHRKGEQLSSEERHEIEVRLKDQWTIYKIARHAEYEKCREMMLEKYNPPLGKIVSN